MKTNDKEHAAKMVRDSLATIAEARHRILDGIARCDSAGIIWWEKELRTRQAWHRHCVEVSQ
jgi:hypothetical protein